MSKKGDLEINEDKDSNARADGKGGGVINGSDGDDRLFGGRGKDFLDGGAGDDSLFGGNGKDSLYGGNGDDFLYGGNGKDFLDGGAGDDSLYGGNGKDFLDGGAGDDSLYGGNGKDSLYGGAGEDSLFGGNGRDTLYGGSGNDIIKGGRGKDTLYGGEGDDTLTGGRGSDYFVFDAEALGGRDTITDFRSGIHGDVLDLRKLLDGANFGNISSYLSVEIINGNSVITIDVNGDGSGFGDLSIELQGVQINSLEQFLHDGNLLLPTGLDFWAVGDGNAELTGATDFDMMVIDLANSSEQLLITPMDDGRISIVIGNETLIIDEFQEISIIGTEGDDNIVIAGDFSGTDLAPDTVFIDGLGGNDLIDTSGVTSTIPYFLFGGAGDDSLKGTAGSDRLYGQRGNDSLFGFDGDDTLYGGGGDDRLIGGSDNDTLFGGAGNDALFGGRSNDTLDGGTGNDTIDGGSGWDTLVYGSLGRGESLDIDLSANTAKVISASGFLIRESDTVDNIEEVVGGDAGDKIHGDANNNILYGGEGDDRLSGGGGTDTLNGGAGSDWVDYSGYAAAVLGVPQYVGINLQANTLDQYKGSLITGVATLVSIENLRGSQGDDFLLGNGSRNILVGEAGNDGLNGGDGIDLVSYDYVSANYSARVDLTAGTGKVWDRVSETFLEEDILSNIEDVEGSSGNDELIGDALGNALSGTAGNDWINGRGGNDRLFGGADDDTLIGGLGDDLIDGGTGLDWVDYSGQNSGYSVQVNLTDNWGGLWDFGGAGQIEHDTITNIENIRGAGGNDALIGDGFGNTLEGLGGNDWLEGRAGDDRLFGGAGDDSLDGGLGFDTIDGGAGSDWVNYIDYDSSLSAQVNLAQGWGGLWDFSGTTAVELERDTLSSLENIRSGGGDDALIGNSGANIMDGGAGDDWIEGRGGMDTLYGQSGSDQLFGNEGVDQLLGGSGADILDGGLGRDTLDGGSGVDTATYASYTNGSVVVDLENNYGAEVSSAGKTTAIDTFLSIENVTGSAGNDVLLGSRGNNTLDGLGGDDRLRGGAGDDLIIGGAGRDTVMLSGAYNDYVIVGDSISATVSSFFIDGFDTLEGVEVIEFDEGQVPVFYLDGRDNPSLPPSIADLQVNVNENLDLQLLGTVTASDPENKAISFEITGGQDASLFKIDVVTGQLFNLQPLNFEDTPRYDFTVTATDADGLTNDAIITIVVNDIDEAPLVQGEKIIALGDDAGTVSLRITEPVDPEGAAVLATITVIPNNGVVRLADGTGVAKGDEISAADLAGLTFTPTAGKEGITSFQYEALDQTSGLKTQGSITIDLQSSLSGEGLTLIGEKGDDILIASRSPDNMTGSLGADTFVFVAGDKYDNTITDFNPGEGDRVDFSDIFAQIGEVNLGQYFETSYDGTDTQLSLDIDLDGRQDMSILFENIDLTQGFEDVQISDAVPGFLTESLVAGIEDFLVKGRVAFTDADLFDTHQIVGAPRSTGTLGALAAEVVSDTTFSNESGEIEWTYSIAPSAVEYLAEGEVRTERFVLTLADANGNKVDVEVAVEITGTNDSPYITGGALNGQVTEALFALDSRSQDTSTGTGGQSGFDVIVGNDYALQINTQLTDSGSISFSDADASGTHRISDILASTDAIGALTAEVSRESEGSGADGQIDWNYSVSGTAVEYLAAGEVISESFTVTLADDRGAVTTQTIDITIQGSNDKPWITGGDVNGYMKKTAAVTDGTLLTDAGYFSFVDADLNDIHSVSITSLDTFGSLTADVLRDTTGLNNNGLVAWEYEIEGRYLGNLNAGEVRTERFEVTLTDGNGGTSTQTITLEINGGDIFYDSNAYTVNFSVEDQSQWSGGEVNLDRSEFWGIVYEDKIIETLDLPAVEVGVGVGFGVAAGLDTTLQFNNGTVDASASYDVELDSSFDSAAGILILETNAVLANAGGYSTDLDIVFDAELVFDAYARLAVVVDPIGFDPIWLIQPDDPGGEIYISESYALNDLAQDIPGVTFSEISSISTADYRLNDQVYGASGEADNFLEYRIDLDEAIFGPVSPFGINLDAGIIDIQLDAVNVEAYAGANFTQDTNLSLDGLLGTIHFVDYEGRFNTSVDFIFGETVVVDFDNIGDVNDYLDASGNLNYFITMTPVATFSNEINLNLNVGSDISILQLQGSYDFGIYDGDFNWGPVVEFNPRLDIQDLGIDLTLYDDEFDFQFQSRDSNTFSFINSDSNLAPDARITYLSTDESQGARSLGFVNATDPEGGALSYAIYSGNAEGLFTIDANTGEVFTTSALDHEDPGRYVLSLRVTDMQGKSDYTYIAIDANDVNEVPVSLPDQAETFRDAPVVIDVAANDFDEDADDTLSYQFHSQQPGGTISNNGDGTFTFDPGEDFINLGVGESYTTQFWYTAIDNGGLRSTPTNVSVTVRGVAIEPNPYLLAVPEVDEEGQSGLFVTTVVPNDFDAGDSWTFDITAGNSEGLFRISANGDITTTASLNFEDISQYDLEVTVTDSFNLVGTKNVSVQVVDINEAPVSVFDAAATDADTTVTIDVSANDLDPDGDDDESTLSYELISIPPDSGQIENNGDGTFTFDPGQDFTDLLLGESRDVSLTYRATDSNGLSGNVETIVVTVAGVVAVNTAPQPFYKLNPFPIAENQGVVSVNSIDPGDSDNNDSWTYDITDGNTSGLFSIDAGGNITTTGPFDYEATQRHELTITVTDSGGLQGTVMVPVDVSNINESPSLEYPGTTLIVDENQGVVNVTAPSLWGDVDVGDTLKFDIASGNDRAQFSINPDTGVLSTNGPLDYEDVSSYDLVVRLTDDAGLYATANITVNVGDVFEAPGSLTPHDSLFYYDAREYSLLSGLSLINPLDGSALFPTVLVEGGATSYSASGSINGLGSFANSSQPVYDFAVDSSFELADSIGSFTYSANNGGTPASANVEVRSFISGDNNWTGGSGNDVFVGSAGRNTIRGGAGNDIIYGQGGGDFLRGEDGNDYVFGGTGVDTIYYDLLGSAGSDLIDGGEGSDTFQANIVDIAQAVFSITPGAADSVSFSALGEEQTLYNVENISVSDSLSETSGFSGTITGDFSSTDLIRVNLFSVNGVINVDASGVAGASVGVAGSFQDDTFVGGEANDNFNAIRGGNDTFSGGGGRDTLIIASRLGLASVIADGGTDVDQVQVQLGSSGVTDVLITESGVSGQLELTIDGIASTLSNFEWFNISDTYSTPTGTLNVTFSGDLSGALGSNVQRVTGRDGAVNLDASAVTSETIFSATGGAVDDVLRTGAGADIINGLGGADVIDGGLGADRITGGTGNDRFIYSAVVFEQSLGNPSAKDVIVDYNDGEILDLAGVYDYIETTLGGTVNSVENFVATGATDGILRVNFTDAGGTQSVDLADLLDFIGAISFRDNQSALTASESLYIYSTATHSILGPNGLSIVSPLDGVTWIDPAILVTGGATNYQVTSSTNGIGSFPSADQPTYTFSATTGFEDADSLGGFDYSADDGGTPVTGTVTIQAYIDAPSVLSGGEGNDVLIGGELTNTLQGLGGNDILVAYGTSYNKLYGGDGEDVIYGSAIGDWLYGGPGNDVLYGMAGFDSFVHDLGPDQGEDLFFGGADAGLLRLNANQDVYETIVITPNSARDAVLVSESGLVQTLVDITNIHIFERGLDVSQGASVTLSGDFDGLMTTAIVLGAGTASGVSAGLTVDVSGVTNTNFSTLFGNSAGDDTYIGGIGIDGIDISFGGTDSYILGDGDDRVSFYGSATGLALTTADGGSGSDKIEVVGGRTVYDTISITAGGGASEVLLTLDGVRSSLSNFETLELWESSAISGNTGMSISFAGDLTSALGGATSILVYSPSGGSASIDASLLTSNQGIRVSGSAFDDVVHGGPGGDQFQDPRGNDTYIFSPGGGIDTLSDFDYGMGSDDRIDLSDFGLADFNDLLTHATQSGSNLLLDFGVDKLFLVNVNLSDLHADDFILDRTVEGHQLLGTAVDNTLVGTTRSDSMTGDTGADTFIFIGGDTGSNLITDFSLAEDDEVDLTALFARVDSVVENGASLDDYLDFSFDGINTNLNIDIDNDGVTDTSIQFQGINLVGADNDITIIDYLLDNSNLDIFV